MVNVETNKDNAYDILQNLFEEFAKKSVAATSCLGEKCSQYSQIKAKQNLFMTIISSLIIILIAISISAHVELGEFKESSHLVEINTTAKRVDLARQVKGLNTSVSNNILILEKYDNRLDSLKLDIERIKVNSPL